MGWPPKGRRQSSARSRTLLACFALYENKFETKTVKQAGVTSQRWQGIRMHSAEIKSIVKQQSKLNHRLVLDQPKSGKNENIISYCFRDLDSPNWPEPAFQQN